MTVGKQVVWTLTNKTTKNGVIIAIVPAGGKVKDYLSGLQKAHGLRGLAKGVTLETLVPRGHESYVIHVPSEAGHGKLYWPKVKQLKDLETGLPLDLMQEFQ